MQSVCLKLHSFTFNEVYFHNDMYAQSSRTRSPQDGEKLLWPLSLLLRAVLHKVRQQFLCCFGTVDLVPNVALLAHREICGRERAREMRQKEERELSQNICRE